MNVKTMFCEEQEKQISFGPDGAQMTSMGPFEPVGERDKKRELINELKSMYLVERSNMRRLLVQEPGEAAEFAIRFHLRGYLSALDDMIAYLEGKR